VREHGQRRHADDDSDSDSDEDQIDYAHDIYLAPSFLQPIIILPHLRSFRLLPRLLRKWGKNEGVGGTHCAAIAGALRIECAALESAEVAGPPENIVTTAIGTINVRPLHREGPMGHYALRT
jgi:hypothetical protein